MPLKGTNNLDNNKGCKIITQDPSLFTYLSLPLLYFIFRSGKETMSQLSDWKEKKKFSFMSEKEEKISEEWYVKLFCLHSDFQK